MLILFIFKMNVNNESSLTSVTSKSSSVPVFDTHNARPSQSVIIYNPRLKQVTFASDEEVSLVHVQSEDTSNMDSDVSCNIGSTCGVENCSSASFLRCILEKIPVILWLPRYPWRQYLLNDTISGITIAFMHIPQGLAFAHLGNVPPIIGIYTSFFPVIVYLIFGTSRHISIGTFAVACLMTGHVVSTHSDVNEKRNKTEVSPVEVATAVTFVVGLSELIMHIFHLDVVCTLLSKTFVSAFTTGAAVHVLTSQVQEVLGLKIRRKRGPLTILYTYIEIGKNITKTNWIATLLFVITVVLIIISNFFIKPRIMKRFGLVPPIELCIITLGTIVSSLLELTQRYSISVVGHVPIGFPDPQSPNVSLLYSVALDGLLITFVVYCTSMSMALMFSTKLSYKISPRQELFAHGLSNIVGSFFLCLPVSSSLSRSLVQVSTGGQTQVASIISCFCLLIVLLFFGPFMEPLPRSILAGIIITALSRMFLQFGQLKVMWQISKLDFFSWILSFLTVVVIDIDIGLACSLVCALISIFLQSTEPYICLLGRIPIFPQMNVADIQYIYIGLTHEIANEIPGIKIIQLCGPLNFATYNYVQRKIYELSGINPSFVLKTIKNLEGSTEQLLEIKEGLLRVVFKIGNPLAHNLHTTTITRKRLRHIVLDFTLVKKYDFTGVSFLELIIKLYNQIGVNVTVVSPRKIISTVCTVSDAVALLDIYIPTSDTFFNGIEEESVT